MYLGIVADAKNIIHRNAVKICPLSISVALIGRWLLDPIKASISAAPAENTVSTDCSISLGSHICLLLFTFGIWQLIRVHKTIKFTNFAKDEEVRDPTAKLLLYLLVPFYSIYWAYKSAQRIDKIAKERGAASDLATVCLILSVFIPIIPPVLMQDKINQIVLSNQAPKNDEITDAISIKKYKELLDKGIITQEEFDAKKKQLLGL